MTENRDGSSSIERHFAPIEGPVTEIESRVVFDAGGNDGKLGLARSSARMRSGSASVTLRFAGNDATSGGILIGFDNPDSTYFAVTLRGHDQAYAITENIPGLGLVRQKAVGSISSIPIDQEIELTANVTGQLLTLKYNGIDVITHRVPEPLKATSVGLFAWGKGRVDFQNLRVQPKTQHVFVIMPFREPYFSIFRHIIQPVTEKEAGMTLNHVGEIERPGFILDDIMQQIDEADAVIADISRLKTANVFYELGYAHALKEPSILLVNRTKEADVPFDLRGRRFIPYDNTITGEREFRSTLLQHLISIRDGTLS